MTARCRAAGNALCELLTAAGSPEMAEAVAAEIASSVPAAGWATRRRAFSLLAAADAEAAVPAFQKVLMSEQHKNTMPRHLSANILWPCSRVSQLFHS